MRSAHCGNQARLRAGPRPDGGALLGGGGRRSGHRCKRSAPSTLDPAPQYSLRRSRDDAESRAAAGHDRNIDGEFIPSGEQLAGAVEGIDQDEAAGEARSRACRPPPTRPPTPGSTRARPSRMAASAAWSAAVTGEKSALVSGLERARARRQDGRSRRRHDGRELVEEPAVQSADMPVPN